MAFYFQLRSVSYTHLHYGAAERFAKVAANAIIANVQAHGSNENQFFIDTARGMITGFILLVAIYAPPTARHIISVFELIVQCSAPVSYTHLDVYKRQGHGDGTYRGRSGCCNYSGFLRRYQPES